MRSPLLHILSTSGGLDIPDKTVNLFGPHGNLLGVHLFPRVGDSQPKLPPFFGPCPCKKVRVWFRA